MLFLIKSSRAYPIKGQYSGNLFILINQNIAQLLRKFVNDSDKASYAFMLCSWLGALIE